MDTRVSKFEEVAKERWIYLEEGDSKKGNKCYDELLSIATELRNEGKLNELECLIDVDDDGVKFEVASKLLTVDNVKAEQVLLKITEKTGTLPFTAKMTLKQWRAGKLKF